MSFIKKVLRFKDVMDSVAILHSIAFSLQKASMNTLGSGHVVLFQPTLDIIKEIEGRGRLPISGKDFKSTVNTFGGKLKGAGLVKKFLFREVREGIYSLEIRRCFFAKHVHDLLDPRDVVCPYALLVMALYEKFNGKRVKFDFSTFTEDGSITAIEPEEL